MRFYEQQQNGGVFSPLPTWKNLQSGPMSKEVEARVSAEVVVQHGSF